MNEEQQQSSREYTYEEGALPNTVPPPHNQANMSWDRAIHPAPEMSQESAFVPPPAANPVYCDSEPHRVSYAQYRDYGPPNEGATHIHHHTPCPQPTGTNNIAPSQPRGTMTARAVRPPFLDIPFGGMAENTPLISGRPPKRNRQDPNDANDNPAVPGTSMANIYRELAVQFTNNPQANIIIIRMESTAGRSRVTIELEIVDTVRGSHL